VIHSTHPSQSLVMSLKLMGGGVTGAP